MGNGFRCPLESDMLPHEFARRVFLVPAFLDGGLCSVGFSLMQLQNGYLWNLAAGFVFMQEAVSVWLSRDSA